MVRIYRRFVLLDLFVSLPGGRCAADRLDQAAAALHELDHLLRGHALPPPVRLSLPLPPFSGQQK